MGIFKSDGTRVTKASFPSTNVPAGDVPKKVTEDLYVTRRFDPNNDGRPDGSVRTRLANAGDVLTQKQIDALFPAAVITGVSPATGLAAGGTKVTITGANLDGVSGVKFGATDGTSLKVLSPSELEVTTPAGAAGPVNIVLADDSGTTTKNAGFTYQ